MSADPQQGLIREIYRTAEGKAYRGLDTVSDIGFDEDGNIQEVRLQLPKPRS